MKDIDAYRNFGIFSSRSKLQRFDQLCDDIKVSPSFMLECFIDDLCDSFTLAELEIPITKGQFAAKAFYFAYKEYMEHLEKNYPEEFEKEII